MAPGLYILLPLGFRVWRNIRNIVWDVMEEHGVQNFDTDGIIWPEAVTPFRATIVPTRYDYEDQKKLADELYQRFKQKGLSVLLDDRDERAGVKFKDADLIGCPWRINIGRKAEQGIVELRNRRTKEMVEITIDEVIAKL